MQVPVVRNPVPDVMDEVDAHPCEGTRRTILADGTSYKEGTPYELDGDLLRAKDILHACAVQTIWRLRCGVGMDDAEAPTQPVMAHHVLSLAKEIGLPLPE